MKFKEMFTKRKRIPDEVRELFQDDQIINDPLQRQQLPDGSVPETIADCAHGWKAAFDRKQAELEAARADAKHCEELCMEACRHLCQFRPEVSQAIVVRIKRVVNGHCEVPLTQSE